MTQPYDLRFADGTDALISPFTQAQFNAFLKNRAYCDAGNSVVHTPSAAAKTGFLAVKFVAKSSGLVDVNITAQYAAAAADVVTLTVDVYTDSVPGTPLTLPANAVAVGAGLSANVFQDNSGAGIAPSGGATAVHTVTAPQWTQGTAFTNAQLEYDGLVALTSAGGGVPAGQTIYVVFSVTNSVAARAITQATVAAFELP